MFKVTVVGNYIARSKVMEKEKIQKPYEITGNIPTLYAALSIVKNKLLGPALAAKYPDYVTFLTYHIVKIEPLDEESKTQLGKMEINFMDRDALLKYIKENALPVDARYYPDLFKLREAVQYAKEDPKGYSAQFALREPDLRLDLEMAQCNPELFKDRDSSSTGFVASISIPAEKLKASSAPLLAKKTDDRLAGLKADQIRDGEMAELDIGDL